MRKRFEIAIRHWIHWNGEATRIGNINKTKTQEFIFYIRLVYCTQDGTMSGVWWSWIFDVTVPMLRVIMDMNMYNFAFSFWVLIFFIRLSMFRDLHRFFGLWFLSFITPREKKKNNMMKAPNFWCRSMSCAAVSVVV